MKNKNTAPSQEGANLEETVAQVVEEVPTAVEVIPSNVFIAKDGTKVEFSVKEFIYKRKTYTVEEAVSQIPEELEELYKANSFIFKKS